MTSRWYVLFGLLILGAYYVWSERELRQPPGVLAPHEPRQVALPESRPPFEKNGYWLQPLAFFEASARVLSKKFYIFDRQAELAPVDLALGWGDMSDSEILNQIDISQENRFLLTSSVHSPLSAAETTLQTSNVHIIPANETIEAQIKSVRKGQIVSISGYLVEARATDGFKWRSSLVRTDSGNGACELLWVDKIAVHEK